MNSEERENIVRNPISPADVLGMLPPGLRYRFLDNILEIDRSHVVACYRFREQEFFYPGHFPERAVTPGTILLEAMCQCGMAAQSYYLLAQEMPLSEAREYRILFTGAEVEWFEPVFPGATITIRSELIAWRRRRIRARVRVFNEPNRIAAESCVAGMSVLLSPESGAKTRASQDQEQFEAIANNYGGIEHESR